MNLALGKNTNQSSDSGSELAVDSYETTFTVISKTSDSSWWVVDLDDEYMIGGISLKADFEGNILNRFSFIAYNFN